MFKRSVVYKDHFFDQEMAVIDKAMDIVDAFNAAKCLTRKVYLNRLLVGRWLPNLPNPNERALMEPFLTELEKWNSGWVATDSRWSYATCAISQPFLLLLNWRRLPALRYAGRHVPWRDRSHRPCGVLSRSALWAE